MAATARNDDSRASGQAVTTRTDVTGGQQNGFVSRKKLHCRGLRFDVVVNQKEETRPSCC
ncbi:hypothetical protein Bca101_025468 [Brassica carinata]